ncbi:hypothetical protein FHS38_005860 [Streptomyces netropsis]|uniref:Uncharacterized protein n=1 Tax=Streptomyces netropsis TaxID=55404 RepID=A0A7W7LGS9_STRNE|nr:hypothetical protein [Streptomyces netropsis]
MRNLAIGGVIVLLFMPKSSAKRSWARSFRGVKLVGQVLVSSLALTVPPVGVAVTS